MSTKIYDGAKLTVGIAKAYQLLLEAKPEAVTIAQVEQNYIIADMVLDHVEEKGEECTPFAAYLKLTQMRREKADLMWMCGYDLGFEVAIIPRGSHCLAIPFSASKALLDWFAQLPFVKEYGYSSRFQSLPMHGEKGILPRHCTGDFKVKPIQRHLKELLGVPADQRANLPEGSVELWIGISWEEIQRMKPSDRAWIRHRWPLLEKRMTRGDCRAWMHEHGFDPPPPFQLHRLPVPSRRGVGSYEAREPRRVCSGRRIRQGHALYPVSRDHRLPPSQPQAAGGNRLRGGIT